MPKITIIGSGSLVFSSRVIADALSHERLSSAHIALVDIDPLRLEYSEKITRRIIKEGSYDKATCSVHQDHRAALTDSDFVVLSILVGGFEAIKSEIDIPMKYGVSQAIGDTLAPGGIMRCLRTLPILIEIAADIIKLCPDATVLNYTNPMSMLCWGMYTAHPDLKLAGLCHSVQGTAIDWSKRLDVPFDETEYTCAGLNHQAWYLDFKHQGKDLYPQMKKKGLDPVIWNGDTTRMEYLKHLGYAVTESSAHNSEYSPWWRKTPEYLERYCPGGNWNGGHGHIKTLYERPDWEETMQQMADWKKPVELKCSHEYSSYMMNAILGGESCIVNVNVRNEGLIDNLPAGCCVEVPCLVDANGLHPQKIGSLPVHLAALNRNQATVQELAVKAALESDPETVFQALALDPLTASVLALDDIRAMTRELLTAHAKYLPGFQGKILADKPLVWQNTVKEAEQHIDPAEMNN